MGNGLWFSSLPSSLAPTPPDNRSKKGQPIALLQQWNTKAQQIPIVLSSTK